jgi:chemotaxis protein CheZ
MTGERNIALRDAHDYLQRVIETLRRQKGPDGEKSALIAVLAHISSYIQLTRRELASLRTAQPQASLFSSASDELGEVVNEAARATNEIMSAAEEIERYGARDGAPDPALTDLVTRIYVACAFQDITGQRIAKVVQTLQSVESKVSALATACGGEVELHAGDEETAKADAALLNGPQRSGNAQSQDDIDRLFASL